MGVFDGDHYYVNDRKWYFAVYPFLSGSHRWYAFLQTPHPIDPIQVLGLLSPVTICPQNLKGSTRLLLDCNAEMSLKSWQDSRCRRMMPIPMDSYLIFVLLQLTLNSKFRRRVLMLNQPERYPWDGPTKRSHTIL